MTEIPKYSELNFPCAIEVQVEGEIIQMIAMGVKRGSGKNRLWLEIDGVIPRGPYLQKPCQIMYGGKQWAVAFRYIGAYQEEFRVSLQALISDESYWA